MANIKSIGGNPIVLDASGIAAGAVTPDKLADMGGITAGAALGITGEATDSAEWLQRVTTSDGPTTIRSIHGNTVVQDGALVPVNMAGIETTGFNAWDEQTANGYWSDNGTMTVSPTFICCKNKIPVFPGQTYYIQRPAANINVYTRGYDANNTNGISLSLPGTNLLTIPDGVYFIAFAVQKSQYGTIYNHDICINLSDPTRNGTYAPHWHQTRPIPAGILRSAGSIYDELTSTEAITRVGVVDLGSLTWTYTSGATYPRFEGSLPSGVQGAAAASVANAKCAKYDTISQNAGYSGSTAKGFSINSDGTRIWVWDQSYTDAAAFKTAMSGVMLYYALATPTTTPIDPALNLTYRTEAGGTERVMVPTGEQSAPPTLVTAQGYTAESLRDAALSAIAPVENWLASTNYGVGSYLIHGGQLCKVTTAIATGESISIGTNVTATTVMAEVIALIAQ